MKQIQFLPTVQKFVTAVTTLILGIERNEACSSDCSSEVKKEIAEIFSTSLQKMYKQRQFSN